jgi:RNA polymerase sigma-70 factor (ECF subfamily)
MRELPDTTLEALRRGDRAAFRALVETYQDRVFALCAALAGADAEDVAQETFLRVHRAIGGFDPRGAASLSTWMLTIARRLCTDRARGARLRVEVPLVTDAPTIDAGDEGDPVERRRLRERLVRAIQALPEEQRAVVALREWDGLSYEEIAALEGVPVGTVRSRLARAREALRAALGASAEERHAG